MSYLLIDTTIGLINLVKLGALQEGKTVIFTEIFAISLVYDKLFLCCFIRTCVGINSPYHCRDNSLCELSTFVQYFPVPTPCCLFISLMC